MTEHHTNIYEYVSISYVVWEEAMCLGIVILETSQCKNMCIW